MTLNDLERRNSPYKAYFAFFPRNSTDFQTDYITVVEGRPIMSVKYCLPVPVFYFWPKLYRTVQRGLSAIAEHLIRIVLVQDSYNVILAARKSSLWFIVLPYSLHCATFVCPSSYGMEVWRLPIHLTREQRGLESLKLTSWLLMSQITGGLVLSQNVNAHLTA